MLQTTTLLVGGKIISMSSGRLISMSGQTLMSRMANLRQHPRPDVRAKICALDLEVTLRVAQNITDELKEDSAGSVRILAEAVQDSCAKIDDLLQSLEDRMAYEESWKAWWWRWVMQDADDSPVLLEKLEREDEILKGRLKLLFDVVQVPHGSP